MLGEIIKLLTANQQLAKRMVQTLTREALTIRITDPQRSKDLFIAVAHEKGLDEGLGLALCMLRSKQFELEAINGTFKSSGQDGSIVE